MKVLVTGGSGFIGSHLVDALVNNGNDVTIIDSMTTGLSYKNPSAKYIVGNLQDKSTAEKLIQDFDIVFHLASNFSVPKSTEDPRFDFENNLLLTFNVLDAMRKNNLKKIVFTSTSAVYGRQKAFPIREDIPFDELRPISNYAASKLASEIYIHSFSNLYKIDGLVLRLANVIGPRSNHGIVPDIVKKINNNPSSLEVLGNGKQKKSYIHVSDCIGGILTAAGNYKGFDIFNIGSDEWITVDEIVETICNTIKVKPQIIHTGGESGWAGDVPEFLLDTSKIKSKGWVPSMSIKDAIVDAVNWMKQNNS